MEIQMPAYSYNEKLARTITAAFMLDMNPTVEEVADVKTAVSEAVTNSIIHGYGAYEKKEEVPMIRMICKQDGLELTVIIEDEGCGIADIAKAMEPLYTTRPDLERSGMGFAFMEAFMNEIKVISSPGEGTKVIMKKKIAGALED
ncbi:MAG: anti-sigma F factor [Lachnospiraceae bacterium]|nr:anti-sigma F factor [Lachnospiraceae bacterium]